LEEVSRVRHLDWNLNNDSKGELMLLVVAAKDLWSEVDMDGGTYELGPR